MSAPWLVFLLSGAAVVVAGVRLSRDSDVLAERTGIGRVWIGAILLAAATSLPELTTDLYAVREGQVNLAIGDLFGSSMANILILGLLDLSTRHERVLARVARAQVLVGTLAIGLTALAGAGILTGAHLTLLGVGWAPLVVGLGYLSGIRILYANREVQTVLAPEPSDAEESAPSLTRAVAGFAVATLVILVAARFLASSAAELADVLGVSTSLVGITLLALTTSLPELVVGIASIRAGAYDLAVGNLLGSNCFNMAILLALDVADGPGSLLAQAEPTIVLGALFAILLMSQALIDVLHTAERRAPAIEPGPWLLIGTYALGVTLATFGSP